LRAAKALLSAPVEITLIDRTNHHLFQPLLYRDLGSMAMIGRNQAVAELFAKIGRWGFPAFVAWGAIHLAYLVGWGSRIETVARWGWTLLARNRRERLISVTSLAGPGSSVGALGRALER
jgi:NADH dehydrogenase